MACSAAQLRGAHLVVRGLGPGDVDLGEEAEGPDPTEGAGSGGDPAGAGGPDLRGPHDQRPGDRPVLVSGEGVGDCLYDDLVPRHVPPLPLRPAHEHRVEGHDPAGHGRCAGERSAGHDRDETGVLIRQAVRCLPSCYPVIMSNQETATLGGGCFWCLEAVYDEMEGVISVESGYMGGHLANPDYRAVCTGTTGHVEVVQVTFAPAVTSYRAILEVFFAIHDPTSLNRQGNDSGTQYRSAVFTHSEQQSEMAHQLIAELDGAGLPSRPVVTEVRPATTFYEAEEYHQEYFVKNPGQGYCS